MRKTSSLLASVLLLALPLSACGSGDSDSNASQDASSTTSSRSDEEVIAASQAAPEDDGSHPTMQDVDAARILLPDADTWVPESWWLLDTALSITRLPGTELVLVVGRVGGPGFLASEVSQIGDLGSIIGAILS